MPPCAILIADMAGFSRLCEREGNQAGMQAAIRFHRMGDELATTFGGCQISTWGDNFLLSFPTVREAYAAGQALVALVPASVGIGWGDVEADYGSLWGVEVNRASRLGEDVAGEGEVLLTDAAIARLEDRR